jgi:hypothetical protein
MVSVLASSAVDCRFKPRSGQTKDYKIGIRYVILFYTTLISFTVKPCIKRSPFDKEKDAL